MRAGLPHPVEVLLAVAGLVLLSPVLVVIAAVIRLTSPGPALYRQERIGRGGVPFRLWKFRTMCVGADEGGRLTVGQDERVTAAGAWLRRHKLDELLQLVNVVRGDMSLVGARPEVAEYVLEGLEDQRLVLSGRPGLTDPASLAFRDEAALLAGCDDPSARYRCEVLPAKLRLSADYQRRRTALTDVGVLLRTAVCLVAPGR